MPFDSSLPDIRTRLLDATLSLVSYHGFAAAPTQEIARWAKLGTGTLFRHFPTKDALLHAAFAHATARLQCPPCSSTPLPPEWTLQDLLRAHWWEAARRADRDHPAFHYWRLFRGTPLAGDLHFPLALPLGPFEEVPQLLLEAFGPSRDHLYHAWQLAAQWTAFFQFVLYEGPRPADPDGPTPAQRMNRAYAAWWASTGLAADTPVVFLRRPGED